MNTSKKFLIFPIILGFTFLASCTNGTENTNTTANISTQAENSITTITAETKNIVLNNETITITEAGEYTISGQISDGKIIVDAGEDAKITLRLAGVNITNSTGEAMYIKSGKATIELVEGTENILSDEANYADTSDDAPNATLYAEEDLVITGNGKLAINANSNDALTSKDDLIIENGNITINAKDDAIRGKDSLTIKNGNITITAGGDGLKSDDETKGNITIDGGNIEISSQESDGIQAYHTLTINSGNINIKNSVEGLEAEKVIINGGDINIVSTDDGINASSSTATTENRPGQADENLLIEFNGGNVTINAKTDGIDSNGNIKMTGGNVVVYGPEDNGNAGMDYDGKFTISGGNIAVFGSSGMAQNASTTSTQNAVLIGLTANQSAGTKFSITDASGNTIFEHTGEKAFQSVLISNANLKTGETYTYLINEEKVGEFTISSTTTNVNISGQGFGGMGMPSGFGGGRGGMPPQGFDSGSMTPPNMPTQN